MNENIMGKQITKLRLSHGMTQPQLGDKMSVSRQTISNWENGVKSPRMGALQKMSDLFNVSIGYITDGEPDNIIPITSSNTTNIPVIGSIACGTPILAEQNITGYIPTYNEHLPKGTNFYLNCSGDSMEPKIENGSRVLIHAQPDVENDEIAAVLIDGSATLKRVKKIGKQVILMPENNKYDPIPLDDGHDIRIIGKAIEVNTKL